MKTNMIKNAAKILRSGGVVAFPTETVFGIGAALDQPKAIKQIFKIKNRPKNKPLQVLATTMQQAKRLGRFSKKALDFAQKNWPGPFTLVVYKTRKIPKLVTGGSKKVGIRMPHHKIALELIKKCGPIAATSANRSGEKPALSAKEARNKLPEIDYVIPGRVRSGKPSKVVDLTKGFKILRK
jgi:L-threonylcarbamoyladenylate synthase